MYGGMYEDWDGDHEDSGDGDDWFCRVLVVPSVYHFGHGEGDNPEMPGLTMYNVDTCEKFCLQAGTGCIAAFQGEDTCGEHREEVPCNAPFDVAHEGPENKTHMCECGKDIPHLDMCLDGYGEKYGDKGTICPAGTMVDGPSFHGMMVRTIADLQPTQLQTLACPEGFLGSVTVMCGAGGKLCPLWNDCQPIPSEMCHSVGAACFAPKIGDAM
jgi:hypothetical protein